MKSESNSWVPYGKVLKDYFNGEKEARVSVYNDLAGKEYLTGEHLFRGEEDLEIIEHYALDLCEGKILDVGAGSGAVSLILKERGFNVVPMDIATEAVEVMKARGLDNAIDGDIFDFIGETFDTILMIMNGIGIVGNLSGLELFLNKAHDLVKADGQILLDSSDMREDLQNAGLGEQSNYIGEVIYRLSYKNWHGRPYKWLFIDPQTLGLYCRKTGWRMQVIYEENKHYLARLVEA